MPKTYKIFEDDSVVACSSFLDLFLKVRQRLISGYPNKFIVSMGIYTMLYSPSVDGHNAKIRFYDHKTNDFYPVSFTCWKAAMRGIAMITKFTNSGEIYHLDEYSKMVGILRVYQAGSFTYANFFVDQDDGTVWTLAHDALEQHWRIYQYHAKVPYKAGISGNLIPSSFKPLGMGVTEAEEARIMASELYEPVTSRAYEINVDWDIMEAIFQHRIKFGIRQRKATDVQIKNKVYDTNARILISEEDAVLLKVVSS